MRILDEIGGRVILAVAGIFFTIGCLIAPRRAVNAMKYALNKDGYWN